MARYLVRRLGFLVLVLFGITLLTFILSRVAPADPARLMAGARASPEAVAEVRERLGLDRPMASQYVTYMDSLLHGDLGRSIVTREAVRTDLARRLPATLELILYALTLGSLVGATIGVLSSIRPGGRLDVTGRFVSVAGLSLPDFWVALILQFVFYSALGLLPFGGRLDTGVAAPPSITGLYTIDALLSGNLALFAQAAEHLVLPVLTLMLPEIGIMTKIVRTSMLEVVERDFVRTARAKGLSPRRVYIRHALRNAMLPAITVMGLEFGFLIAGTVFVETIFAWPGLGRYAFDAIASSDYSAIMGVTIVVAVAYSVVNVLVDLVYAALDPRVRLA